MGVLIEAVRVSKFYGSTRALRDVSVAIAPGEVVAFSGANGSGKTTLLRVLSTLTRPSRGEVRFPGLGGSAVAARRAMGFVSHEAMGYGDLTALENVELAASLVNGGARVDAIAGRLGVHAFAERPLRACSRGQRQRVAVARALVGEPRLLLLDEPTTGLDGGGIAVMHDVVRDARDAGCAVAVVIHDRGWLGDLVTRELCFERGRVVT